MNNKRLLPSMIRVLHLVKTLSQPQKRAVQRFATIWGTPEKNEESVKGGKLDYIELFDVVSKSCEDDDPEVKLLHLIEKKYNTSKRSVLGNMATYLYDKILQSTRHIPDQYRQVNQINMLFQEINFLRSKGLYVQANELANKAIDIAEKFGYSGFVSELCIIKLNINSIIKQDDTNLLFSKLEISVFNTETIIKVNILLKVIEELIRDNKKYEDRYKNQVIELITLSKTDSKNKLYGRSKVRLYVLFSLHYYFIFIEQKTEENTIKSKQWSEEAIKYYLNDRDMIENDYAQFFTLIVQYLQSCLHDKDLQNFQEKIALWAKYDVNENQYLERLRFWIDYYVYNDEYSNAREFLSDEKVLHNIRKYSNDFNSRLRLIIQYSGMQVFFRSEDYKQASQWAKYIVNEEKSDDIPFVRNVARMVQVIAKVPDNNKGLLELKSHESYYKRKYGGDSFYPFLEYMVLTLKKGLSAKTAEDKNALAPFVEQLYEIYKSNRQAKFYQFVVGWIGAHIKGTNLNDEIKNFLD